MKKLGTITVTDIIDVKTVISARGDIGKVADRRCWGISFCEGGKITYIQDGKKYVSDKSNVVLLPKGSTYMRRDNERGLFYVINFEALEDISDEFQLIEIDAPSAFIKSFERMQSLSLFEGNHAKVMSIFYSMLDILSAAGAVDSILMPALKYIENNFSDTELKNDVLARECKISEVYFRKLFLKQLKTTPKQFIMDVRIQKAKQLLEEDKVKISLVAEQCGFASPYHFCRLFKKKTGITPTEYMKQNKTYKI